MNNRQHILDWGPGELAAWCQQRNIPSYRAEQVLQWIYQKNVFEFGAMSNLPADLKVLLNDEFLILSGQQARQSTSDDDTLKILTRWSDENLTETVMIPEKTRRTVCVSSQVGCPVGCTFCASGMEGLTRSLKPGEMVEQVLRIQALLGPDHRVGNIVMMGMGEPLANYQHVLTAVRTFNASWAFGIGARQITISTVGLPDRIRKLAHEELQFTLAVSLHAGNESVRQQIIPWAQRTSTEELFSAIDYFYDQTHREVTLEYILLDGVNTSDQDADKLAYWARQSRCNVNLINYNEVAELPFKRLSADGARAFKNRLRRRGINAHLRPSRGRDIDAACGQLRRRHLYPVTQQDKPTAG